MNIMNEEILQFGQDAFLLAIKELESLERYEACEYAKNQLSIYCDNNKIKQKDISQAKNIVITPQMKECIKAMVLSIQLNYTREAMQKDGFLN